MRLHKVLFKGLGIFIVCFTLWHALEWGLQSHKGIDLTDEGLYLLEADPYHGGATFRFPSGWHTGPLFRLVGYDIADFRTLGAFLLFFAGAYFGWQCVHTAVSVQLKTSDAEKWVPFCGAVFGGLGAMFYYAGFLRVPSYNWVNIFGLLLTAAGYLVVADCLCKQFRKFDNHQWAGIITAGFGLFFSLPGKPSSAPVALMLGSIFLFLWKPGWRSVFASVYILFAAAAWISLAVAFGFWEWPVMHFFLDPFEEPKMTAGHTTLVSLTELLSVPWLLFQKIRLESFKIKLILCISFLLIVVSAFARERAPKFFQWLGAASFAVVSFVSLKISKIDIYNKILNSQAYDRWLFEPSVTACLLLWLASLVLLLGEYRARAKNIGFPEALLFLYRVILMGFFTASFAFLYSFGSGNGVYPQTSMALVFLVVATLATVSACFTGITRKTTIGVYFVSLGLSAFVTFQDSYAVPYRMAPLSHQTERIAVGSRGAYLFLEPKLADDLNELREEAEAAGWKSGMPLLGVVWSWASTVPYFLGARLPDCHILTGFGYGDASVRYAEFKIQNRMGDFPARNAWILTNAPESLREPREGAAIVKIFFPPQPTELREVLNAVEAATGRKFPDDYNLVAQSPSHQLWKPRKAAQ
jgi:hypothetical protein